MGTHLLADLVLVALHKCEQAQVPDDRKSALLLVEGDKVIHECIDDPIREGVLLVKQCFDEETRHS